MNEFMADESGGENITVEQLDEMVVAMRKIDDEYKEKKDELEEISERYETARAGLLSALKAVKKTKYHVDGLGTAFIETRYSFRTPKEVADKEALYEYIKHEHGEDVLANMISINSQTLNGFCKKEIEIALEAGVADFEIPGVGQPTAEEKVKFRKG